MNRYIDVEKLERFFNRDDWDTPDERWRPESEFGRFVDTLPREDVAPVVHAHWNKTCVPDVYQCSACKSAVKMDMLCDSEYLRFYCPICGAKMDEVVEDAKIC